MNVLIVDDQPINQKLLHATLEAEGHTVAEATNGVEALELLESQHTDAVISDILMPRMDGYRLCSEVRKRREFKHLPFIHYTATYISPSDEKLSSDLGADVFLRKPAPAEEIIRTLYRITSKGHKVPATSAPPESDVMKEYSERLVAKLEQKNLELTRALQRSREQADIINHARDAIVIRNFVDQRVTFWNTGAERLYGWSANEAIGRPLSDLIVVDPQDALNFAETIGATGQFSGEVKQRTKDGKEIIVEGRATLIVNPDGRPGSVLLINTDITEQKRLETQLLRAQRLETIGTLASGVAHDLNNILTPILMGAEILHGAVTEKSESLVSLIEDSARRGVNIVKQMLTFARGVEGERVVIDPKHLIGEMSDIAQQTFPKSIQIKNEYAEAVWSIESDPTQIHQVLLNLSVNARDAMPDGGLMTIGAENFEVDEHYASMTPGAQAGPHVMLRVSDTGAGMTRAVIDKIFDPFFTTKEIGKGTGLGLFAVLGIVKSHGGFISVYSEIGKGTTFKVFLPAKMTEENSRKSETLPQMWEGNGELVLVIDDEPGVLRITKLILEKHNYRVLDVNDAPEAIMVFAREINSVQAVLTDIMMPAMDGVMLIRAIKKMKPTMKFIASTGQGEETRVSELQSMDVVNFLTKPYDTERLLKTLHDTLTSKP